MHPNGQLCRRILLTTVSGFTLVAMSHAGRAQAAAAPPPAPSGGIEQIIVTAQKRAENVQKVPATVTVIGGKSLENAHIDTGKALSAVTTNLTIDANANFVAPYIRGVGTQYANPGLEPSVATYFDDLYLSRASGGLLSFSDVARVEVLKGPQGTLYGMSDTGGAIRIITRDPTEQLHFGTAVTVGNYGQVGTDDYISGQILPGLTGRLAVEYDHNDGYVHSLNGGPNLEDRNSIIAHGKLFYKPNDQLTVKVIGNYVDKRDHEGQAFLSLFPGLPEETGVALGGVPSSGYYTNGGNVSAGNTEHLQDRGLEVRADYALDNVVLSSISGYWQDLFRGYADLDTTSAPLINAKTGEELTDAWSQEFQAVSTGDGPLKYTAGVYYYHELGRHNFGVAGYGIAEATGVPDSFLGGDGKEKYDSVSPYVQASYSILPNLDIVAGARYTSLTKNLEYNNVYLAQVTQPYSNLHLSDFIPGSQTFIYHNAPDSFSSDQFAPKIGLNYRPMKNVLLYASWQRGFKSGGFNLPNPSPAPVEKVQDEQLDAIEVGAKSQFGNIQLNADYFHYNSKNQQVQITNPTTGVTSVVNAASSTTNGVEAELTARLYEGLTFGASIAYLDASFDNFPDGPINRPCPEAPTDPTCIADGGLGLSNQSGNLKGNQLPLAPHWTSNLRLNYSHPVEALFGDINAGIIATFTDSFYYTPDNLYGVPSKWLVNANLGWQSDDGHWAVNGFVTNLTNLAYITHIAPYTATGGWFVPGPPREYGVRLSYNF